MTEDPEQSRQTEEPEGRADGMQNVLVHDGAPADDRPDTNERADSRVEIQQPDGHVAPVAED